MTYYRTCPLCGAHLDPGERCDCQEKEEDRPGAVNAGTVEGGTEDLQAAVSSSSLHE